MKTHTFSIVVGTNACNANCPYCVSKMTGPVPVPPHINWGRFNMACRIVEQARDGLVTVLLTGKGEPMLYPQQITDYLRQLENFNFPLVELQTNGTLIERNKVALDAWSGMGLGLVCISITSDDSCLNNELMGIKRDYYLWGAVKQLHDSGLAVRLNCTMLKGGVHTSRHVDRLITACGDYGVEQLTLREVEKPGNVSANCDVAKYVDQHKPGGAAARMNNYLLMQGATKLLDLPHGGVVFDYHGQNVCIGNCLTGTTDPDDIRQIIFFPNGQIRYDWRYPGARLL